MMLITVLAKLSHLLAIFQFYWRNPIILPQTHQPKKKAPATTMVTGTFQLLEVILFYFPLKKLRRCQVNDEFNGQLFDVSGSVLHFKVEDMFSFRRDFPANFIRFPVQGHADDVVG